MVHHLALGHVSYETYAAFLEADSRRCGDVLELGHDWLDRDGRYRVCWYTATGELTAERLDPDCHLEPEDFEGCVTGPVQLITAITTREELAAVVGKWPTVSRARPRTLARLRELVRS